MQNPLSFWVADIHRWEQIDKESKKLRIRVTGNGASATDRILLRVGDLMISFGENLHSRYAPSK